MSCRHALVRGPARVAAHCSVRTGHVGTLSQTHLRISKSTSSLSFAARSQPPFVPARGFAAGGFTDRLKSFWKGTGSAETGKAAEQPQEEKKKKSKGSLGKLGEKAMDAMKGPEAVELESRLQKSQWDLDTYRLQLVAQQKSASKAGVLKYLPGNAAFKNQVQDAVESAGDPRQQAFLSRSLRLIDAMTPQQKANPGMFSKNAGLAKVHLAKKCGVTAAEVQEMLDQYVQMSILFKHMFALRDQGVELPDQYDELMAMVMAKSKFSPKEMQVLATIAAKQGVGAADQAAKMGSDPRLTRQLGRKTR